MAFGNPLNGASGRFDRVVYLDNSGRIWFGVNNGANRTVNSPLSYNNNQWHLVTASLGSNGMRLYVDGNQVASRTDVTSGVGVVGDWQVGLATLVRVVERAREQLAVRQASTRWRSTRRPCPRRG